MAKKTDITNYFIVNYIINILKLFQLLIKNCIFKEKLC